MAQEFYIRWCRGGHKKESWSPIGENFCPDCGEPYAKNCEACGEALREGFISTKVTHTVHQVFPYQKRPDNCEKCGGGLPWKPSAPRRLFESVIHEYRSWDGKSRMTFIVFVIGLVIAFAAGTKYQWFIHNLSLLK